MTDYVQRSIKICFFYKAAYIIVCKACFSAGV